MQPNSSAPPPRQPSARPAFKSSPGASPPEASTNEFADAVARMFEKRQEGDGAPVVLPRIDPPEEGDDEPSGIRGLLFSGRALRRALMIVPLAIVGYSLVWFFYLEPSQGVRPEPATTAKVERQPPVEAVPAAPPRPAIVEAAAPPAPAPPPPPAASQVVAPPPQPAAAAPDLRPLTREEIKELQGKLGAIGFAAGPVDGVVGPQTQAALRRYGEARRLPTAEANREVLSRLRGEAAAKP